MRFEIPDELVAALADAIASRLPRAAPLPSTTEPRYLTRREAAREYRVEAKTLLAAERAGSLAAYKPGRHVLYKRVDLERMIEASGVEAREEGPAPANDAEPADPFDRALARAGRRSGK